MSFTDIFIRRPVLATVVSLMILLVGLASLFNLPVRQFPKLTNTTITITTAYPGANADVIRGFITTPMLQAVASAEGIDTLTSSSQAERQHDHAQPAARCQRRPRGVGRAVQDPAGQGVLPREAQDPMVIRQTGDPVALMYMSFNSPVMTSSQITDYLTRVVQPRLQTIDGVANAQILGGQTFAMRVWLNPDKMAALAITPLDVRNALAANNFVTAAGQVKGDFVQTTINAETSLNDPAAFAKLVVATRGDALIRLDDIATIELGPESADSSSVFDGLKAVFVGVFANPTANPLTVIAKVRKAFPDMQRQLPAGLEAAIAYDATKFIEASIHGGADHAVRGGADRDRRHLPVPGQPALDADPDRHHPALADRRDVRAAGARLLASTCSPCWRWCWPSAWWSTTPSWWWRTSTATSRRACSPTMRRITGAREIAVPVISMTITLAAVYAPIGFVSGLTGIAVSRVRLHAGRRRHRLRRHRADAVADDGLQAAQAATPAPAVSSDCSTACSPACAGATSGACTARSTAGP